MYGMGTSVDRASAGTDLFKRGEAFGIKGKKIDGMDVFKVIEAPQLAGDHVRSGKGPYILEVQTYRYKGHSMSDPAKYRTKEELESYKINDPIILASKEILKKKILSKKDLEKINSEIVQEIKDAAQYAIDSPFPDEKELFTNVYL